METFVKRSRLSLKGKKNTRPFFPPLNRRLPIISHQLKENHPEKSGSSLPPANVDHLLSRRNKLEPV